MSLRPLSRFSVPDRSDEVTPRGGLSKWQWALVLGIPLAAAAALAGLALVIRRRRRDAASQDSPQPSMNPTPIASPTTSTAAKKAVSAGKEKVSSVPIREQRHILFLQPLSIYIMFGLAWKIYMRCGYKCTSSCTICIRYMCMTAVSKDCVYCQCNTDIYDLKYVYCIVLCKLREEQCSIPLHA